MANVFLFNVFKRFLFLPRFYVFFNVFFNFFWNVFYIYDFAAPILQRKHDNDF